VPAVPSAATRGDHSASGLGGEHIGFMPFPNQKESELLNSKQAREAATALVATDVAITKKPFLRYVTGSITNSSDHRFSYLVVKIELLDENRRVVGDVADAVLDFGPGQIWNFEAGIVSEEAVAAAQVKEIKGWL
jgi:hypothetical protein